MSTQGDPHTVTTENCWPDGMESSMRSTSQPYCLVCPHCHRIYTDQSCDHYEKHINSCQLDKPFHCDKCDARFLQSHVLKRHQLTHTKQLGGRCPICGKALSNRFRLREHVSTHDSPDIRAKGRFKCTQCDKSFLFKASLHKHYHSHIDGIVYKCTGCAKEFSKYHMLYRHRKGCEKFIYLLKCDVNKTADKVVKGNAKNVSLRHKCQLCMKSFSIRESLNKHVDMAHDPFAVPDNNLAVPLNIEHCEFYRSKMPMDKNGVLVPRGVKKPTMSKRRNLNKKHVHPLTKQNVSTSHRQRKLLQVHSRHIGYRYLNVRKTKLMSTFLKNRLHKARCILQQKARFELQKTFVSKVNSVHQTNTQQNFTKLDSSTLICEKSKKAVRPRYCYQCAWCSVMAPFVKLTHHINTCHQDKLWSGLATIYVFLYQRQLVHCISCPLTFDSIHGFKTHHKKWHKCTEKVNNSKGNAQCETKNTADTSGAGTPTCMSHMKREDHSETHINVDYNGDDVEFGFCCINAEFSCSYCKFISASDIVIENHIKSVHWREHVMPEQWKKSHLGEHRRPDKGKKRANDEGSCTESTLLMQNMSATNIWQTESIRKKNGDLNETEKKEKPCGENLNHVERRTSKRRIKVKVDEDFDYGNSYKHQKKIIDTDNKHKRYHMEAVTNDNDCRSSNNGSSILKKNPSSTKTSKSRCKDSECFDLKKRCRSDKNRCYTKSGEFNDTSSDISHTEDNVHELTDKQEASNNAGNNSNNVIISKTGRLIKMKTKTDFQYTNHLKQHKANIPKQKVTNGKDITTAVASTFDRMSDADKNEKTVDDSVICTISRKITKDGTLDNTVFTTVTTTDVEEISDNTCKENSENVSSFNSNSSDELQKLKKHQHTYRNQKKSGQKVKVDVLETNHGTTRDELTQGNTMENSSMNSVDLIQVACPHCKYLCRAIEILKDHIMIVHKDIEASDIVLDDVVTLNRAGNKHKHFFPCLQCLTAFPKREELKKHKIEKHKSSTGIYIYNDNPETGEGPIKWLTESGSFTKGPEVTTLHKKKRKRKIEKQKRSSCSEEFSDAEDDNGDSVLYKCTTPECTCSTVFQHKMPLRRHKKTKHKKRLIYSCSICKSQYADGNVYKTHIRLAHSQSQYVKLELVETRIFCEKINEDFHVDICTACGKTFSGNRSAEYEHTCIPSQIKYFCPYCKHFGYDFMKIKEHIGESHPDLAQSSKVSDGKANKHVNLKFPHVIPGTDLCQRDDNIETDQEACALVGINDRSATETKCTVCDRTFASVKEMLAHTSVHTGIRPFACGLCGFSYTRQSGVAKHMAAHCRDIQHACQYCPKRFVDKADLQTHERTHTGDRPHKCEICGNRYCAEKSVRKHMQLKHPDLYKSNYIRNDVGPRQCEQCGMVLWSRDLTRHYEKKHAPGHVCKQCGEKFTKESQLKRHVSQQHRDCKQVLEQLKMISDKVPGTLAASLDSKRGQKVQFSFDKYKVKDEQDSDKPWQCTLCGEKFRLNKFINLHLRRIHTLEMDKTFSCPFCKRGFPLLTEMKVHLRSHTNYRPYKCRLCKKSFKQVGHINDHMRTHTNRCVTSCTICGKQFKMPGNLGPHVKSHCKLRPYKCFMCTEDFIDLNNLITHSSKCGTDTNNLNNSYTCHMCCKEFNSVDVACKHLINHKTDRPFVCEKCPESFHRYGQLYKHKVRAEHFTPDEIIKTTLPNKSMLKANNHFDLDLDVLLKQYDFVPADNFEFEANKVGQKAMKSSRQPRSHDAFLPHVAMEKQTLPVVTFINSYDNISSGRDGDTDLILVAQQLAHMGDFEHPNYTDVYTATDTVYTTHTDELEKDGSHTEEMTSIWEPEVISTGTEVISMETEQQRDIQTEIADIQSEINVQSADQIVVTTQGSYELTGEACFDQCEDMEAFSPVIEYTNQTMTYSSDLKQEELKQTNIEEVGHGHVNKGEPKYVLLNQDRKVCNDADQNIMNNLFIETNADVHDFCEDVLEASHPEEIFTTSETIPYIHSKTVEVQIKPEESMEDSANGIEGESNGTSNFPQDLTPVLHPTYKVIDASGNEVLVCVLNEDNSMDESVDEEVIGSLFHNDNLVIQSTETLAETDTPVADTETLVIQPVVANHCRESTTSHCSPVASNDTTTNTHGVSENKGEEECSIASKVWGNINDIESTTEVKPGAENFKVNKKFYNRKQTELTHPFKCPDCPKRFKEVKFMNNHRKTHLSDTDRKHQCSNCGKGFTSLALLTNHENIHLGLKPFKCDKCAKCFRQRGHLMTHLRLHENYRPFQCDVCENSYVTNSQLKKHYLRHTRSDAVEYKCDTCHQVFQEHRNLQRHRLSVHLSEADRAVILRNSNKLNQKLVSQNPDKHQPEGLMCDLCGKSYARADILQQHLMRHQEQKTIPCPQCSKKFASHVLLSEHLKSHMEGANQCDVCGQMYRGKPLLARHMKSKHACDGTGSKVPATQMFECTNCNMKLANKNKFLYHVSACFSDIIEAKITNSL